VTDSTTVNGGLRLRPMEPADLRGMQGMLPAGTGAFGAGGTAPSRTVVNRAVGCGAGGTAPSRAADDQAVGCEAGGPAATPAVAGRPERKHPVHLANVERFNQATILFVTVCTQDRRPVLACPSMHALLREAWSRAERWTVGRYMIMPDHVHLFCSPADRESENVKRWVAYWKGMVARAVEGHGPLAPPPGGPAATPAGTGLWQRDCWDTQLRDARPYGENMVLCSHEPGAKGTCGAAGGLAVSGGSGIPFVVKGTDIGRIRRGWHRALPNGGRSGRWMRCGRAGCHAGRDRVVAAGLLGHPTPGRPALRGEMVLCSHEPGAKGTCGAAGGLALSGGSGIPFVVKGTVIGRIRRGWHRALPNGGQSGRWTRYGRAGCHAGRLDTGE